MMHFLIIFLTLGVAPAFGADSPAFASQAKRLQEAKVLTQKGKYLEAQKVYDQILSQKKLTNKEREALEGSRQHLAIKILFSSLPSQNSFTYVVLKDDTLGKIAKKFNTTIELIQKSNGLKTNHIQADMKLKILKGKLSIKVDKSENRMTVFLDKNRLKWYSVSTGKQNSTPIGTFRIVTKIENPTWYYAGLAIPPKSDKNDLGTRWMGFNLPGYGIHGTTEPEKLGIQASKGCVRMHNRAVEELFDLIPVGTQVAISN